MNPLQMLSAVKRMAENVTQTFDIDALLLGILNLCLEIPPAQRGALYLRTDPGGDLVLRAQVGYDSSHLFNLRQTVAQGAGTAPDTLLGLVFKEGKPLILNSESAINVHLKSLGLLEIEPLVKNSEVRCCNWAGIPIRAENHGYTVGVLTLHNAVGEQSWMSISNHEQEFLVELAGLVSGSINRISAHNTRMFNAVYQLINTISGDDDLDRNIENVLETFDRITEANGTSIWLIDGGRLYCRYAVGHYKRIVEEDHEGYEWTKDVKDGPIGLTAWIAQSNEFLHLKTREQETNHRQYLGRLDSWLYPPGLRCESFLGAPLRIQGNTIGVIKSNKLSDYKGPNRFFTEEEAQQFRFLALIAAAVIKSAKDRERVNRTDQMLIQLYEIGTLCNDLTDINEILWYFLIGLTNAEGIGINRAALFEIQGGGVLRRIMAVGPTNHSEANKVQRRVDEKRLDMELKYCLDAYRNNGNQVPKPLGELMSHIDNLYIEFNDSGYLNQFISNLTLIKPSAQTVTMGRLDGKVARVFHSLDFEEGVIFGLRLGDGRGLVGFCDYIYTPAFKRESMSDIARLIEVFLKQIQLAIQHLELSRNQQQVRERALQEFRASTAHRIGTEIADISGALRRLRTIRENSDDTIRHAFQRIDSALIRMRSAVTEYSRLAIERPLHYKRIDLQKLMLSVINADFPEKGTTKVLLRVPDPAPPCTHADEEMLSYAFSELLHNAFKAINDNSQGLVIISLEYDSTSEKINIRFTDNGDGIPAENRNRIFDSGFTTRVNGTGQGLYIVSRYISNHHGVISLAISEIGCCFLITLPVEKEVPREGVKVLIVDDVPNLASDIRDGIFEQFSMFKLEVVTTKNDALACIDQNEWDIVVTDIALGEDDPYGGMDLLKKIRRKGGRTKTIMVTAHAELMVTDEAGLKVPAEDQCKYLGGFAYIYRNRPDGTDYIDGIVEQIRKALGAG